MIKWLVRFALAAVVLFVVAFSVGIWQGSTAIMKPPWYEPRTVEEGLAPFEDPARIEFVQGRTKDPLRDFGYVFEDVEFPAEDGSTLRGWYVPPADSAEDTNSGIVAVHGAAADRREFLRHLPLFHEAGYPVLLFDSREHGISDGAGRGISYGVREHADVISAVEWAKRDRGWENIGVIGTSQGGASVILAAAADDDIDAVVSINPFTDVYDLIRFAVAKESGESPPAGWLVDLVTGLTLWRIGGLGTEAPIDVVDQIAPRPLLLIHGTGDQVIPFEHSERLHERSGKPVDLWIAPDAAHAAIINSYPDEFRARVIGFFDRSLRGGS